jgi:hypothetical protein
MVWGEITTRREVAAIAHGFIHVMQYFIRLSRWIGAEKHITMTAAAGNTTGIIMGRIVGNY